MTTVLTNPADRKANLARLRALTNEDLQSAFSQAIGLTVEGIRNAADCAVILAERGLEISGPAASMATDLRRVAFGQVAAEVLVRLWDKPEIRRTVAALPFDLQLGLATGQPVKVLCYSPDGKLTHRMLPVESLTPAERAQVFGAGGLNNDTEQVRRLDARVGKAGRPRRLRTRIGPMEFDPETEVVKIGQHQISLEELQRAAREWKAPRSRAS